MTNYDAVMDRFREALINYMSDVIMSEGVNFVAPDGIVEPLTRQETELIIKEADSRVARWFEENK